jgi:hypothetical protein
LPQVTGDTQHQHYRHLMRWTGARRLRSDPRVVDGLVAAALLVFMLVSIATKPPDAGQHASNALAYLLALGTTVPYVAHRRYPVPALSVVLGSLFDLRFDRVRRVSRRSPPLPDCTTFRR